MSERPADRLARIVRERHTGSNIVDLSPATAHEAVTRQMVIDLSSEIGDLRRRVDSLFYLVIAAVVGDVLGRIFGGGW